MLIKFKKPDPRAGSVAQMDSSRGQHFVDTGAAEQLPENEAPARAADDASAPTVGTEPHAPVPAPKPARIPKAPK